MTVCDWNCVSKELKLDTIHIKKNRILNSEKHLLKLADKYVGVFFTIYRKVNKKQYKEK